MHLKKILLFVLLPTLSFAQFSRGQVYTLGSLSVGAGHNNYPSSVYTTQSSSNNFSIGSGWGVFVNNRVAIGGNVGYRRNYQESNNVSGSNNATENSYFANLCLRRYYKITESFYFAAQAKAEYAASNDTNYQDQSGFVTTSTSKSHDASLNVTPYFVFFPSKTWALEASIGSLSYDVYASPSGSNGHSLGLTLGTFNLGIAYYFKRKQ